MGFSVYALEVSTRARELWPELTGGEYGVVLLTEHVFEAVEDLVQAFVDLPLPAITVIPAAGGEGGLGQARLDAAIERALGTKAFTGEEDG